jgi:hypothetical protein
MRTILFVIAICIATLNYAQPRCASSEYLDVQKKTDPFLNGRMQSIEQSTKLTAHITSISSINSIAGNQLDNVSTVIKIPVVVHILYNRTDENISDEQVKTQIDALNRDYRRKNSDTVNTPARFKSIAADVQIEFVLATADPDGRPTSGIIRKKCNRDSWETDDKIKYSKNGGDDAWDSHSYLNIWVGKINKVLGYSTFPGTDAAVDGVVITYTAFGTINTPSPYQLGRTTVHEVGHWLNLKHIWGDEHCGDDFVDDTPKQGYYTTGCPGGEFRSSCDNGSLGDMYMNYMDFTNDDCMNIFTLGQKSRMRSLFNAGGARAGILSSKGLNQPWNFTAPVVEVVKPVENTKVVIKIFPNPAITELSINFADQSWTGKKLMISGINGKVENAVMITSTTQKINIAALRPGIYFIEGFNGDQRFREKFIKL